MVLDGYWKALGTMSIKKKKQVQKRFRMMHLKDGRDLPPIEFYLLAKQRINKDMLDWVNSHDSNHITKQVKLERSDKNPLWLYQSVIARDATRAHGHYLRDINDDDKAELLIYWDSLTKEQQKQELVSMWARLKWVNSAYHELNYLFQAIDQEYLNKRERKLYLTHQDGLLRAIDDLSLSINTAGAFCIICNS